MNSSNLEVSQNKRGALTSLRVKNDPTRMNWLIDPDYLNSVGYHDEDKFTGEFNITLSGKKYQSIDQTPDIETSESSSTTTFHINGLKLVQQFTVEDSQLKWNFSIANNGDENAVIDNLNLWISLAYVMFRDKDVHKNANQSVAVFPQISANYTKLAAIRRDNTQPNMALYQSKGNVLSIGTFNEYTNRFFENVSPSLDGMLFHEIVLAGGYTGNDRPKNDWIYSQKKLTIASGESVDWEFILQPFTDKEDFYDQALKFGHPRISFEPMVSAGANQLFKITTADNQQISKIVIKHSDTHSLVEEDVTNQLEDGLLPYDPTGYGEHQIVVTFTDGTSDMGVFNVMSSINDMLKARAIYISEHSYSGKDGKVPYSFSPISNQGESIGKMTFVLQECLLEPSIPNREQLIANVEESAVKYVVPKWFIDNDFTKLRKLYGDFYRVMDLEYIAHMFYLLSKCSDSDLKLNSSTTYLTWAAKIFDVRVNPDLHEEDKTEAQMLGTYFLYIEDLLKDLKKHGLDKEYREISASWSSVTDRIASESDTLAAAMTEHFFDNAGFGPAAGALALTGNVNAAQKYGQLLKANIGFSNDFRSQSPDRWWEALSYMVHALWGGITAAAAQITGENINDPELIESAYRATGAVLYMYDSNATTTNRMLKPGEAASTYSIAGPNINRPDLSRNRFGQSIFASNGGIFSRLFPDGYTGEDDWDMGEELVAYLNGFGQKTYVYHDNEGNLKVVNGQITKINSDTVEIESFAPYINHYIDLDHNVTFDSSDNNIIYDNSTQSFAKSPISI